MDSNTSEDITPSVLQLIERVTLSEQWELHYGMEWLPDARDKQKGK